MHIRHCSIAIPRSIYEIPGSHIVILETMFCLYHYLQEFVIMNTESLCHGRILRDVDRTMGNGGQSRSASDSREAHAGKTGDRVTNDVDEAHNLLASSLLSLFALFDAIEPLTDGLLAFHVFKGRACLGPGADI